MRKQLFRVTIDDRMASCSLVTKSHFNAPILRNRNTLFLRKGLESALI